MGEGIDHFGQHTFYHGTRLDAVECIVQQGVRTWFLDEDGQQYCRDGNLGTGIYITCNWRMALWFGPALLRVGLQPGTRLLNASEPPDPTSIAYLQREFGREILTKPPWHVIPRNKQLTLPELINLFRYHYQHTWEHDFGTDSARVSKWSRQRDVHGMLLVNFRSLLIRYGFHGYGNPDDDNGIVVFAGDRLILKELIAEVPPTDYDELWKTGWRMLESLAAVRKVFTARGSERARRLAEQIASAW